jgi:hypothetical protein
MFRIVAASIALALLFSVGCGKQGPTYAESVQIYTAETQEFSRLQTERSRIQQSYEARLKEDAKPDKAASLSKQEIESLKTGSIDDLVNNAMSKLEYTQWYSERLKRGEQLKDPEAETEAINAERKRLGLPVESGVAREVKAHEESVNLAKERDEALAKLDKQIAEQQLRVDRAKAVRDEIEARGR